jgi:hypothetical protein
MNPLMYDASVSVFDRTLTALSAILDKAAAHAEAKGFDPANLLNARLAPDMFALTRQVQIACDTAKGASARLAGLEVPKHDDSEVTFAELKARITKTLVFVNGIPAAAFAGSEDRTVTLMMRKQTVEFVGRTYLFEHALPNLFFHVTTAYAILRHNGVEIGKGDYLGPR